MRSAARGGAAAPHAAQPVHLPVPGGAERPGAPRHQGPRGQEELVRLLGLHWPTGQKVVCFGDENITLQGRHPFLLGNEADGVQHRLLHPSGAESAPPASPGDCPKLLSALILSGPAWATRPPVWMLWVAPGRKRKRPCGRSMQSSWSLREGPEAKLQSLDSQPDQVLEESTRVERERPYSTQACTTRPSRG